LIFFSADKKKEKKGGGGKWNSCLHGEIFISSFAENTQCKLASKHV
jgi:hypothetical protein